VPESLQARLTPLERFGKQYVAWAGCLLVLVGIFASDKTYSFGGFLGVGSGISGSVSLWDYARFWSLILLLLVLASAAIAYLRDYRWLLVSGAASIVILLLNFLYAFSVGVDLPGVSAHPSWGWILLFPGALLILAAGAMRTTARDAVDEGGAARFVASLRNR
jgi:hypothetical protein